MTETGELVETCVSAAVSIGEFFRKVWKTIKAIVKKAVKVIFHTCRRIPVLRKRVNIYFRTKNKRIRRKQQKIIFATLARLI